LPVLVARLCIGRRGSYLWHFSPPLLLRDTSLAVVKEIVRAQVVVKVAEEMAVRVLVQVVVGRLYPECRIPGTIGTQQPLPAIWQLAMDMQYACAHVFSQMIPASTTFHYGVHRHRLLVLLFLYTFGIRPFLPRLHDDAPTCIP
jgi:hypothetical protein